MYVAICSFPDGLVQIKEICNDGEWILTPSHSSFPRCEPSTFTSKSLFEYEVPYILYEHKNFLSLQTVVTSCSLENLTSIVDDFQFENFDGNSSSDRLPSDASVTVFCYKTYAYQRYWHLPFSENIITR